MQHVVGGVDFSLPTCEIEFSCTLWYENWEGN